MLLRHPTWLAPAIGVPVALLLLVASSLSNDGQTDASAKPALQRLELPEVPYRRKDRDELLAIHRKALIERGLQSGYVFVTCPRSDYGKALIINGRRVELGSFKNIFPTDIPTGEVTLKADTGKDDHLRVELKDASGTAFTLLMKRDETLVVRAH